MFGLECARGAFGLRAAAAAAPARKTENGVSIELPEVHVDFPAGPSAYRRQQQLLPEGKTNGMSIKPPEVYADSLRRRENPPSACGLQQQLLPKEQANGRSY